MDNPFSIINDRLESIEHLLQDLRISLPSEDQTSSGDSPTLPVSTDEIFTIREVAAYLRCSVQTIHKKKREGALPYYRSGRIVYFKKSEIDKVAQVQRVVLKKRTNINNTFSYNNI